MIATLVKDHAKAKKVIQDLGLPGVGLHCKLPYCYGSPVVKALAGFSTL